MYLPGQKWTMNETLIFHKKVFLPFNKQIPVSFITGRSISVTFVMRDLSNFRPSQIWPGHFNVVVVGALRTNREVW